MRKKVIITVLACGALATAIAVGVAMTPRDSGNRPGPVPSMSPSGTPSVSPLATKVYKESVEDAEEENPVVSRVPKLTLYWRVELLGSGRRDGKLVIDATVYVKPGQDKQFAIRKQRPFIEGWLKDVGQAPGTYVLKMKTEAPHVY
ncbi:MAG TPA: hypothetical protein VIF43_02770 [Patescibacteria group bacterium]|jgi:hypothetical protein